MRAWMLVLFGCSRAAPTTTAPEHGDVPIEHASAADRAEFARGNVLFDSPLRDVDGLGPLYVRTSCGACHDDGARGPGFVLKSPALAFGTSVRPLLAAGAKTPLTTHGPTTTRLGPPLFGRGYVEAVRDDEIERVAREGRGRVSRVVYASEPGADPRFDPHKKGDLVIGRFGIKARIAALEDFVADALQGDMGITSEMRPRELENPDGLTDDAKPGVDMDQDGVRARTHYVRLLAIPKREKERDAIFEKIGCASCHVPSLKTRADYPIREMADKDAYLYTDLLLHDMGDALADGVTEERAGPRDFRTAPLVGLRFSKQLLHDGRASTLEEAIRAHGGEAVDSVRAYDALGEKDRSSLLDFVGKL